MILQNYLERLDTYDDTRLESFHHYLKDAFAEIYMPMKIMASGQSGMAGEQKFSEKPGQSRKRTWKNTVGW